MSNTYHPRMQKLAAYIEAGDFPTRAQVQAALQANAGRPVPPIVGQYVMDSAAGTVKAKAGRHSVPYERNFLMAYNYDRYLSRLQRDAKRLKGHEPNKARAAKSLARHTLGLEGSLSDKAAMLVVRLVNHSRLYDPVNYTSVRNIVSKTKKSLPPGGLAVYWRAWR